MTGTSSTGLISQWLSWIFIRAVLGTRAQFEIALVRLIKGERECSHGPMTCGENPAAVCNSLDSINGLDELYITNFESDTSYLVSSILKHIGTLRTLKFHNPLEGIYGCVITLVWRIEVLEQLQEQCIDLSHLEIDVSLVNNELAKSLLYLRLKKI